jgi:2-polyprenyl-6-methoxyphenol hydroxylase-like FAD-dependent oxidoreductase
VGLTVATELRRNGVIPHLIERLVQPPQYAKAVGIQPRTLEIWESTGLLHEALDQAMPMHGQLMYVNGEQVARMELTLPPDVPYGFVGLPQYATERLLTAQLHRLGGRIERGVELLGFDQDADGVTARLRGPDGERSLRTRYLVGADGAHSVVRKALGLDFSGDAFPEHYMLGDIEVDWSLPAGYSVRCLHQVDGRTDDLLVCIPLPGPGRYRMSMLVSDELAGGRSGEDVAHGLGEGPAPELRHIQAVLDRLAPEPTRARNLRWSSTFRISHRLVDRYSQERVFVVGDAAHIHPPTGAQGMNTGIQDGVNLAWKLALAVQGLAVEDLLASYDAERHPVGEEVVGRTLRHAREGFEADPDDPSVVIRREAQLLVNYRGSSLVGDGGGLDAGPAPGDRAPDCGGLRRGAVNHPLRLFELGLVDGRHTLLLYAEDYADLGTVTELRAIAERLTEGRIATYAVLSSRVGDAAQAVAGLPCLVDADGEYRAAYGAIARAGHLIRPDGYLGYRAAPMTVDGLRDHLARIFAPRPGQGGSKDRGA